MAQPNGSAQGAGFAVLQKLDITEHEVPSDSYPPISSIQSTCSKRLFAAENERTSNSDDIASDTVLYLAYGSNMSAQTFLGMRKIRPLSEMNVSVPTLKLNFSLPGIAYQEPCFANVEYREPSEKEQLQLNGKWDGRLLGVVYEVTKADYRNIMRTEGGGTSYQEIIVPCVPIPTDGDDRKLPKTFMARTLYAPRLPKGQDPCDRSLWERLTTGPYRHDSYYAQPSLRYLNLLRTGAEEHGLPGFYQDYLQNLQPFTKTTTAQKIGGTLYLLAWGPIILIIMRLSALFADERGRAPKPLGTMGTMLFNMAWMSYDSVYKRMYGEGERTQESETSSTGQIKTEEGSQLL